MDYPSASSGTTGNDSLVYAQWEAIHNPALIGKMFQSDEDGAGYNCTYEKLAEMMIGSWSYEAVSSEKEIYDNVLENFGSYFEDLEENSQLTEGKVEEIANISGWSVRGSTLESASTSNPDYYLYKKIFEKIKNSETDQNISFTLYEKGIYLGHCRIDEEEIPMAIYSTNSDVSIQKILEKNYCAILWNHELNLKVKVVDFENYFVLVFFNEGNISLAIQLMNTNDEMMQNLLVEFGVLEGEKKFKLPLIITEDILHKVFTDTDPEILKQVAEAVNKYKDHFEINTVERMSHFLGQTGHETGGFNSLFESPSYTPRRIVDIFPQAKYGHLYEKAVFNESSRNYGHIPVYFDVNVCEIDPHARDTFRQLTDRTEGSGRSGATNREELFPYFNGKQVANAYGSIKSVKHTITINGQEHHYYKFPDELRTDIIPEGSKEKGEKSNMTTKIPNENYIEGLIKVKQEYVGKPELFDVVYACRMGNSNIASKEGSLFAGLGLIHITGKYWYYEISREWNNDPENDGNDKFFYIMKDDGGHYEELINNYDVAVKASMYYWKLQNINKYCDTNNYTKVNELVNGGQTDDKKRKTLTDKISVELNNAKQ